MKFNGKHPRTTEQALPTLHCATRRGEKSVHSLHKERIKGILRHYQEQEKATRSQGLLQRTTEGGQKNENNYRFDCDQEQEEATRSQGLLQHTTEGGQKNMNNKLSEQEDRIGQDFFLVRKETRDCSPRLLAL